VAEEHEQEDTAGPGAHGSGSGAPCEQPAQRADEESLRPFRRRQAERRREDQDVVRPLGVPDQQEQQSHCEPQRVDALLSPEPVETEQRQQRDPGVEAEQIELRRGWWIASGVLLGLSAAGKYMYAVVGVAIGIDWGLALRAAPAGFSTKLRPLLGWGLLSLAAFYAANPYFWPDPLWRLEFSLFYHAEYAGGGSPGGFPPWQPLVWLTTSLPQATARAAPRLYLLRLDLWISLLALLGLDRLWRKQRVYVLWLAIGLLFLLVWNTKWPHYILILSAPLCLAAAEGAQRIVGPLRKLLARRSGA